MAVVEGRVCGQRRDLGQVGAQGVVHGDRAVRVGHGDMDVLPRQGVPPALGNLEAYAAALQWGARSGAVATPRHWWWALRLHPSFGTVEVRAPTAQRLARLLDELADSAQRVGCAAELDTARTMLEAGGPARAQRNVAQRGDLRAVVAWLANRFAT